MTAPKRRGQGAIYKRGARWWISYYVGGRRFREPARTDDVRVAERLLKDRLGAIYAGTFIGPQSTRVTVGELLETLRLEMEARELKGWYALKGIFPGLDAALGHRKATAVTPDMLLRYELDLRAAGLAQSTRSTYLWLLKAAFKLGVRQRRVHQVPDFPRLGALKNARQGFVEPDAFAAVVARLRPIAREIAVFAYGSAWRQAEVLGLPWAMVDRRSKEIRLPDSKNGQPRILALTGELERIIERRWSQRIVNSRMVPLVFHHEGGRAVSPTGLRNWWREAARAAGVPGVIFHDLRRSGVRNMIRAGVTEPVAMSISGHQSASIFRRYNITSVDDQRRALAATQHYVGSQLKPSARRRQG